MRILRFTMWTVLALSVFQVKEALAQQQAQQSQEPEKPLDQATPPIPAIRSPLASAADNVEEGVAGNTQNLTPDTRALAGVQELTLGSPAVVHSYWRPHFDFISTIDSNPPTSTTQQGGGGWTTYSSLIAGVDVHRVAGSSDFSLNYQGGGTISNDGSVGNAVIQELGLTEKLSFRRETLIFIDQMNYLPEAAFGYSAFGTTPLPPGVGVQPGFGPAQTILTPQGQYITNVFATELDTLLTPRSSISIVGSYTLLRYFDNNLLDSNGYTFQAGYNRQLNRKDTLAFFFRFNGFRYSNYSQSINAYSVQASYARRVTGRLSFQLAGGPQIAVEQIPVTGNPTTTGGANAGTTGPVTQVYGTLTAALQYQLQRTALGLSYYHGLSGGAGVLGGEVADVVSGTVYRPLSRTLIANLIAGFSRNSGLVIGTVTPTNQVYDYWYAGGGISHPWGRTLNLSLNYQMQYQTSSATFCLGTACQTSFLRNLISISFGWHKEPIPF